MILRILGVLILLSAAFLCAAQEVDWEVLRLDDGLSDTKCFDVFSDSKGYIWIGTRAGIDRYDGKDVVSFDRSKGLLSDNVFSCFEDSKGRLWINGLSGEPIFIEDGVVHNRLTDPFLEGLRSEAFKTSISEDSLGRIYFACQSEGLLILEGETVSPFETNLGEGSEVYAMLAWHDGLALLHDKGLQFYGYDYDLRNSSREIGAKNQRACVVDDILYMSSNFRLYAFTYPSLQRTELVQNTDNLLISDLQEIDDQLYVSTSRGVFRIEDGRYSSKHLEKFDNTFVSAIDKGADGRLWVASRDRGVYFQSTSVVVPSRYSDLTDISYISRHNEDSLYIGYEKNKIRLISDAGSTDYIIGREDAFKVIKTMRVGADVWMANSNYLFNPRWGGGFFFYKRDAIYSPRYDRFYFTDENGIQHVDTRSLEDEWLHVSGDHESTGSYLQKLPLRQSYRCAIDPEGAIWVGYQRGLAVVTDTVMRFVDNLAWDGSVIDIAMEGNLLHGISFGNGVFIYDTKHDTTVVVTLDDGLPSLSITNICVMGEDIWVTHSLGITHMRRDGYKVSLVKNFGYGHGIPVGDISYMEYIDGELIFVVDEKSFTLRDPYTIDDSLSLIFDDSPFNAFVDDELAIRFDCINYSFGDEITYQYRLLPVDTAWTTTSDDNITLKYLPTGHYTIEARGNHPLKLKSKISTKEITIINHWYNTLWFRMAMVVLLGILIWFLMRIQVLQINYERIVMLWKKLFTSGKLPPIVVKDITGTRRLIKSDDITYIKASGNYVEYNTDDETITVRCTMKNTVATISRYTHLVRVHRSYIGNLDRIRGVANNSIDIDGQSVPYSASYKENVDRYVGYLTS